MANEDYAAFRELLREMLAAGELTHGPARTLALPKRDGLRVGVFLQTRRGFGFVQIEDQPDLFIPPNSTCGALHGDSVAARVVRRNRRTGQTRGEVVRIVTRAETRWVGVLERARQRWFVRPQTRYPTPLVIIADPTAKSAQPGDLVVVEPLSDPGESDTVDGVIIEKLGAPSDAQVLIRAAIRKSGLAEAFPPKVLAAARRSSARFEKLSLDDRTDLRELLCVTIDPNDSRDFDDAISITRLPDGSHELGVHIADVSEFVRPGGLLDSEAHSRGTSTYFPGYVVPMLPETLSNGVCSLQPNKPRLAKSVFITYDKQARVSGTRFANSVIRSNARLTYDQVTRSLAGESDGIARDVAALLSRAERLARRILKRRLEAGMIVLNLPEAEIELSADGRVVDSRAADTSFSHRIIEMFMVEANEAVSRLFSGLNVPHLRRIHPPPDAESAEPLLRMIVSLGYAAPNVQEPRSVQKLLDRVRGKPEEPVVSFLMLRCFSQACYSPSPQGHFALAGQDYCHFTSPIRRYPDLLVHRLLDLHLRGTLKRLAERKDPRVPSLEQLEQLGRETSAAERRSLIAERDATELLLLQLMKTKLGEVFDGMITGAASYGVFVRIEPYLAEGMIRVSDFGGDSWRFDTRSTRFVSKQTSARITLGQRVRVRVAAVDEFRQELVLVPADGVLGQGARKRGVRTPARGLGKQRRRRSR